MSELRRLTALNGNLPYAADGFELRELGAVTKVRIQTLRHRGLSTSAADSRKLPAVPNTVLGSDPFVLWKAPDDWLVYSLSQPPAAVFQWAAEVASEAPLVATDVSCSSTLLELSGPKVVDILLRDCTLDLEGNAIPPSACAQTQFANTVVLIHRLSQPSVWRLFVERSVAANVWEWIVDSAGAALDQPPALRHAFC
jgi:heterotetrameric sarcosine oxidase gamma subunit